MESADFGSIIRRNGKHLHITTDYLTFSGKTGDRLAPTSRNNVIKRVFLSEDLFSRPVISETKVKYLLYTMVNRNVAQR